MFLQREGPLNKGKEQKLRSRRAFRALTLDLGLLSYFLLPANASCKIFINKRKRLRTQITSQLSQVVKKDKITFPQRPFHWQQCTNWCAAPIPYLVSFVNIFVANFWFLLYSHILLTCAILKNFPKIKTFYLPIITNHRVSTTPMCRYIVLRNVIWWWERQWRLALP